MVSEISNVGRVGDLMESESRKFNKVIVMSVKRSP